MIELRERTVRRALPIAVLIAVVAYLSVELTLAGRVGPAQDDGWIYFAFARAFLEGDAFSYPGFEGPVGAVTAPLWCGLLTAAMWVGGATATTAKVLGVAVLGFAVYSVDRLARAATGDRRLAAVVALLTALTARILWGSLSGMEAGFDTALAALGLALHLERRDRSLSAWALAAAVLALAGWARPENFALLGIAALHRRQFGALAIAVLLIALFPAFHIAIYGHAAPLPFYAKSPPDAPGNVLRADGVLAALRALGLGIGMQLVAVIGLLGAFLPFAVPGLVVGWQRGRRARDGVPFLAACLLLFTIARGSIGAQPPVFQQARYFVQLWPLFLIVCLRGFDLDRPRWTIASAVAALVGLGFVLDPQLSSYLAFDRVGRGFPYSVERLGISLAWGPLAIVAILVAIGLIAARAGTGVPRPPLALAVGWMLIGVGFGAWRQAEGVRDTYDLNVTMAKHVAAYVPEGELVACHDIGALGFFGRRPMLDLAGLASPEVTFRPRLPNGNRDFAGILSELRPKWLCVTDNMIAIVNPGGVLAGSLTDIREITDARVRSDVNVTVAGDVYYLIELTWAN